MHLLNKISIIVICAFIGLKIDAQIVNTTVKIGNHTTEKNALDTANTDAFTCVFPKQPLNIITKPSSVIKSDTRCKTQDTRLTSNNLTSNTSNLSLVPIIISDVTGKIIYSGNMINNKDKIKLNFKNKLLKGMYIITVLIDNQKLIQKLVVD